VVTAKRPNHIWHVDLTTVPTSGGFWAPWLPFALPQCWPLCWWLAVALDHYSRRVLGFVIFMGQPTSEQVRHFLGRVIAKLGQAPKYLVSDRGVQFDCFGYKRWCRHRRIRPRFGAVGKQGSIAVVERLIRTVKQECTRRLPIVPLLRWSFHCQLNLFIGWYNGLRPHTNLQRATPDEIYFGRRPACRLPRFEPRPGWPRASPCALPQVLVKGQPGVCLHLTVEFVGGHRHLPRVMITRAA
jgi:putative transposase